MSVIALMKHARANGVEITMATEAQYDKKVMRVRFRSN